MGKKKLKKNDLKPIEHSTPMSNKMKKKAKYSKLPIIKQRERKKHYPDGFDGQHSKILPINISLGTFEDQIIPYKVTEYFINKAGTILLIDCPCRIIGECKNHDITLGCTWMGKGASKIDLSKWPGAHYATKEEALERERLAYENGLVPVIAKLRGDAVIYDVLDYEDQLMNFCHCCSCCCLTMAYKYGNSDYKKTHKRIEGLTVKVDPDKCTGCGECFKVCIWNGLKMKKNKATNNQDNCMGCGRCEMTCPNKAISITIDNYSVLDDIIAKFDKLADISE